MIIGLTGGIGSGKTTVSRLFSNLGVETFSADQINNELIRNGTFAFKAILEHFGNQILLDTKEINKTLLREKVFTSVHDRQWLEQLLHPLIRQDITNKIQSAVSPYVILEIPLLIENRMHTTVDRVLVVDCEISMQIERAAKRDGQPSSAIEKILKTQASREQRLSYSNDILNNKGSLDNLCLQVEELHKMYLKLTDGL
jgi:dephospho-CoA kinase